jgi:plasmid rolling circle replication initiator protein Rep
LPSTQKVAISLVAGWTDFNFYLNLEQDDYLLRELGRFKAILDFLFTFKRSSEITVHMTEEFDKYEQELLAGLCAENLEQLLTTLQLSKLTNQKVEVLLNLLQIKLAKSVDPIQQHVIRTNIDSVMEYVVKNSIVLDVRTLSYGKLSP